MNERSPRQLSKVSATREVLEFSLGTTAVEFFQRYQPARLEVFFAGSRVGQLEAKPGFLFQPLLFLQLFGVNQGLLSGSLFIQAIQVSSTRVGAFSSFLLG